MKSFVRKLCAGLVCACGMSVSVYATDYYVATDGNDMNVALKNLLQPCLKL
ncbi:hypothetical protein [Phocaeicola vulgatus]|uniref:hypothetical protein n=1 Tax=Phocaeicola vulgatus TaxID=821 RepID=UPI00325E493F